MKLLFVSRNIPHMMYGKLKDKYDIRLLEPCDTLDTPVSSHADMLVGLYDGRLIVTRPYYEKNAEEKGYYLSESGSWKHDRFIECRMSQELFADVLKQNVIHMLDNAKAGDFDTRRHFEAYEDFMLADEKEERQAMLAEPSEYDSTGSSNESDEA